MDSLLASGPGDRCESDDERMTAAATAVLQRRLDGDSHRAAVVRVSASHALSPADVQRAWARKKRDALSDLTIGRVVDACPWTDAEVARLARIFPGLSTLAAAPGRDDAGAG
jgi:hypothetical protein